MSKKQQRAIKKKIDEFADINTPRERTMQIAKELLQALSSKEKLQPKTNCMQQIITKIKLLLEPKIS